MKEKSRIRGLKIAMIAAFCMLSMMIAGTAYATERKKVKVAFFPMDGYHIVNEDGSYGGMDVDYLDALTDYVSWDVEYVICTSWSDALEK